ncbi:pilus assembly protein PilP [Photobacterium leiognathi]|uniref:pilus assembly protein PilP n=1 Tax=Photobacterium leiognathi TaxID=553611 RepID=UPI0029817555|nr:pilus assembly protein PilP [Photobacterium leiognathi]
MKHIYLISILLMLSGCNQKETDLYENLINEYKSRMTYNYIFKPQTLKHEDFFYDNKGKNNPLSKRMIQQRISNYESTTAPDVNRPKQALENFNVTDMVYVGLINSQSIKNAIIMIENSMFKVTLGNYLGKNYGKIKSISNDKITIIEKIKTNSSWIKRINTLYKKDNISPKPITSENENNDLKNQLHNILLNADKINIKETTYSKKQLNNEIK